MIKLLINMGALTYRFSIFGENFGKNRKLYKTVLSFYFRVNLKSIKSYRVAKYLLTDRVTSQVKVSEETGVAIGYVNEVLHFLEDLDIVRINYGETVLLDYVKLLEKISMDRLFKQLVKKRIRLPVLTINETESMVKQYCDRNKIEYAFSVFSGLRHFFEYHISYPAAHVYIKNIGQLDGLEKGEGTISVVVLEPDRPDIFSNLIVENNINICEKIQVIIDLYSSGLGRDAAIKFYRDLLWEKVRL
jgi:hypothetical protein